MRTSILLLACVAALALVLGACHAHAPSKSPSPSYTYKDAVALRSKDTLWTCSASTALVLALGLLVPYMSMCLTPSSVAARVSRVCTHTVYSVLALLCTTYYHYFPLGGACLGTASYMAMLVSLPLSLVLTYTHAPTHEVKVAMLNAQPACTLATLGAFALHHTNYFLAVFVACRHIFYQDMGFLSRFKYFLALVPICTCLPLTLAVNVYVDMRALLAFFFLYCAPLPLPKQVRARLPGLLTLLVMGMMAACVHQQQGAQSTFLLYSGVFSAWIFVFVLCPMLGMNTLREINLGMSFLDRVAFNMVYWVRRRLPGRMPVVLCPSAPSAPCTVQHVPAAQSVRLRPLEHASASVAPVLLALCAMVLF